MRSEAGKRQFLSTIRAKGKRDGEIQEKNGERITHTHIHTADQKMQIMYTTCGREQAYLLHLHCAYANREVVIQRICSGLNHKEQESANSLLRV